MATKTKTEPEEKDETVTQPPEQPKSPPFTGDVLAPLPPMMELICQALEGGAHDPQVDAWMAKYRQVYPKPENPKSG